MSILAEGILVDLVPYGERFEKHFHAWHNGPGVFFWTMGDTWFPTQADIQRMIEHRRERRSENRESRVPFGIQTKSGVPIGQMGLNWIAQPHRVAMFSALIGDPLYWGGGYGTDALTLAIDYAFYWLDMRKVWLRTMAINARVVRQMEKVGFTQEAVIRREAYTNGEWTDGLAFGLLREEWPGREAVVARLGLQPRPDPVPDSAAEFAPEAAS